MRPLLAALGGLLLGPLAHAQKPDLDKQLEKHTFTKDKASLPYRLLKPDGYEKVGKGGYPLVIFLHGMGERGRDNKKQLVHGVTEFAKASTRKKHPCFLIAPQCPPRQDVVVLRPARHQAGPHPVQGADRAGRAGAGADRFAVQGVPH